MMVYGDSEISLPAPYVALTVNAVDQYSSNVPTTVYIDGNPCNTGTWYFVSPGTHTVGVDDLVYNPSWDMDWMFNYFDTGSGGNPTTVDFSSGPMTITAYYIWPW